MAPVLRGFQYIRKIYHGPDMGPVIRGFQYIRELYHGPGMGPVIRGFQYIQELLPRARHGTGHPGLSVHPGTLPQARHVVGHPGLSVYPVSLPRARHGAVVKTYALFSHRPQKKTTEVLRKSNNILQLPITQIINWKALQSLLKIREKNTAFKRLC